MEIPNWSYDSGYTGKVSCIEGLNYDVFIVTGEKTSEKRRVTRRDFQKVFELWDRYKEGHIPRDDIQALSRNSTYIISILHWLRASTED
jgi:hypothetical protein